jgi:AraC-like DNA-binding protein
VHTDEDWELCYIASGTADYRLKADEFQLQAGDLLVIGPDDPHVCLGWRGERFVAIFRRSMLRKTNLAVRCGRSVGLEVAGVRIPSRTQVVPWRRTAVEYLLDRLQEESFGGQRAKHSMCAALLAQLLLELARSESERCDASAAPPDSSARRMVERLAAIVQADLANRWTLAELVKRSGYSSTQLCVLFRRATGLSPCQWISQERVHRTCQLLAHTDKTAMQIASEVGFGTRSQFHRVFRQFTGTTPERYRSALRHETHP